MPTETASPPAAAPVFDAPMTWEEVVAHPDLQDLPFKIEQDAWGRLVMSPASFKHRRQQGRIIRLLNEQVEGGEVLPECSIRTAAGVKVADVVWVSDDFLNRHQEELALSVAPEICVEVRSPSNTDAEMEEKITLYLAKGAQEVWFCDLEGNVQFFSHEGAIEQSRLAPEFPARLDS